jgi:hypothetical protein
MFAVLLRHWKTSRATTPATMLRISTNALKPLFAKGLQSTIGYINALSIARLAKQACIN